MVTVNDIHMGYVNMDLKKEYFTKSGKRVVNVQFKEFNSLGQQVTFPIKGTIIIQEKPLKTSYDIWQANGRWSIFKETGRDLVMPIETPTECTTHDSTTGV